MTLILAGTGHRPPKLGGYSPAASAHVLRVARRALEEFIAKDPSLSVMSGMALGWDTALASAALDLGFPLACIVPFEGQESKWPPASQTAYYKILARAKAIVIVSPGSYSADKMQIRNEYMVDHCDHILALWDGTSGGTANCLRYASSKDRPVTNFWEDFLK